MNGAGRVRLGQAELDCGADTPFSGTEEVSVAMRPEDIAVEGVVGPEPNTLQVRIEAMEFLGSFFRADLTAAAIGGQHLQADFSVNLVRRQGLSVGGTIDVLLPRDRIRVFPARSPTGPPAQ